MTEYKILVAGWIGSAYYNKGDTVKFPSAQVKYLVRQGRLEPLGGGSVPGTAETPPAGSSARRKAPVKTTIGVRSGEEI